jgi:small-conductance mechanosensitive channel
LIQIPQPGADPPTIEIPLPTAFETWRDLYLQSALEKSLVFLLCAILLYSVTRLIRRAITANIEDVNRRHQLRTWVNYGYATLLLLVALAMFGNWLAGLGTILALMVAGIAVALQDVLKSVVGWFYLSGRAGVEVGSRIEVDGIVGDVIDIGVLKTTMLEVGGPLLFGRQSTGRLVTVPNYRMLAGAVLIAPAAAPYVWHEVRVNVAFDSDWRRAEEILRGIGAEIDRRVAPDVERGFRQLDRRYAIKHGTTTSIVYVTIGPSGVELTLRFLVNVRGRRGTVDFASRQVLERFAAEPAIRFAYTTYRVVGVDGEEPRM